MIATQNQRTLFTEEGYVTTLNEFTELFKQLMATTWEVQGRTFNLSAMGWSIGYNNNKTSLGICYINKKHIEISKALLLKNLDKAIKFEDTIRHEIAHAIDGEIRGHSAHDYPWKVICGYVGAEPTSKCQIRLAKPKGKYTATCGTCGGESQAYRKPKRKRACGACCNGTYNADYILEFVQNY